MHERRVPFSKAAEYLAVPRSKGSSWAECLEGEFKKGTKWCSIKERKLIHWGRKTLAEKKRGNSLTLFQGHGWKLVETGSEAPTWSRQGRPAPHSRWRGRFQTAPCSTFHRWRSADPGHGADLRANQKTDESLTKILCRGLWKRKKDRFKLFIYIWWRSVLTFFQLENNDCSRLALNSTFTLLVVCYSKMMITAAGKIEQVSYSFPFPEGSNLKNIFLSLLWIFFFKPLKFFYAIYSTILKLWHPRLISCLFLLEHFNTV